MFIRKPWIQDTYLQRSVPDMPDPIMFANLEFSIHGRKFLGSLDSGVPFPMIESSLARMLGLREGDITPLHLSGIGTVHIPVKTWYFTSLPPKLYLDYYDIIYTPYEAVFTRRVHEARFPFIQTGETKKHRSRSLYAGFIRFSINGKTFDAVFDTGEYKPIINQEDGKKVDIEKYPKSDMIFWDTFKQGYKVPLKVVGGPSIPSILYLSDPDDDDSASFMGGGQIIDRGYHAIFTKEGLDLVWSGQIVKNRIIHT